MVVDFVASKDDFLENHLDRNSNVLDYHVAV